MKTKSRIILGIASLLILIGAIVVFSPLSLSIKSNSKSTEDATKEIKSHKFSLINVNTAAVKDFEKLPGIGLTKAQAILSYRESHGSFSSPQDLLNVNGIGKATLEKIEEFLTGFTNLSKNGENRESTDRDGKQLNTQVEKLVDINHASVEEIATLPYIGLVKAKAIVDYRMEHGYFKNILELEKVKGIGAKTIQKIEKFVEIRD
jgi:competence protein ComEA